MPAFAETKVVLISSAGAHGLSKSAAALLDAILDKPIRQQDLLDCLLKRFSASDADIVPPVESVARSVRAAASASPLEILLVEDNRINQQFALALLTKAGHIVDVVDNGHKAVDAVRKHQYDVVLMDIQMPELDGIEATKQIRALPPPACNAYIIAMTANAMSGAREAYVAAGMNDYLSKPIDAANLLTRLQRLPTRIPAAASKPAAEPAPSGEAVDIQKLEELTQYLPISGVVDLVTLFIAESGAHAMRIKSYLAASDLQSIAREAHIMVSTAGNIGAMTLSATARRVERACKARDLDDFGALVAELDREISAANATFGGWVEKQKAALTDSQKRAGGAAV
jgi:CheY-like chemotaxis protein/HPt (histidine-containing phosphotransfer) domain-containing protein